MFIKSFENSFKTRLAYIRHKLSRTPFGSPLAVLRRRDCLLDQHHHVYEDLCKFGYSVIPNYMSEGECQDTVLGLKAAFELYPNFVHQMEDKRIFGIEQALPFARKLAQDLDLQELGELVNQEMTYCAFTLGGWLRAGRYGSSGNGWHRDSFFSQYKAMIYLTDVNEQSGPFELLPGSHNLRSVITGIEKVGLGYMQDRISDKQVANLENILGISRETLTGLAGTLVIFNSSTIHRGRPIERGERLTLTNYYFPISRDLRSVLKQFSPVLTASNVC